MDFEKFIDFLKILTKSIISAIHVSCHLCGELLRKITIKISVHYVLKICYKAKAKIMPQMPIYKKVFLNKLYLVENIEFELYIF